MKKCDLQEPEHGRAVPRGREPDGGEHRRPDLGRARAGRRSRRGSSGSSSTRPSGTRSSTRGPRREGAHLERRRRPQPRHRRARARRARRRVRDVRRRARPRAERLVARAHDAPPAPRPCRRGERTWVVDGTPTDCVNLALCCILKANPPDFVFSGINAGPNLGDDVTYSGTVACAFEGTLLGVPSIAFSLDYCARRRAGAIDFTEAEKAAAADHRAGRRGPPAGGGHALERQHPAGKAEGVPPDADGAAALRREHRREDRPARAARTTGSAGAHIDTHADGTDLTAVAEGCVSVTPLHLDMTDYRALADLERLRGRLNARIARARDRSREAGGPGGGARRAGRRRRRGVRSSRGSSRPGSARDPRVVRGAGGGPAPPLRPEGARGRGLRRPRAPDRVRPDDHAGGERGPAAELAAPDAGARASSRSGRARATRRPSSRGSRARSSRSSGSPSWPPGRRAAPRRSASRTSRSRSSTAPTAGASTPRTTRSSWPRPRPRCRSRSSRSSKPTGRLVVPVGRAASGSACSSCAKLPNGRTRTEDAGEVAYVPLVGRFGFATSARPRRGRTDDGRERRRRLGRRARDASSSRAACRESATARSPPASPARCTSAGGATNLDDGRVEVIAQGPAHALDRLEAALGEGSRLARVDRVDVEIARRRPSPEAAAYDVEF